MDESRDGTLPDVEKPRFFKGQAPAPMIARSFCSPELLAHIAYSKYVLGLPLHRLDHDGALEIGYETAMRWTKGKYAFFVV